MALRVDDILVLPPVARARPETVVAGHPREVTWVHSSEIYEIAPLLSGGEVLLTTGLGLVGCDDRALVAYAGSIADRGAAALVLELGRTFPAPPPALVRGCEEAGLRLVVLHTVVPFAEIARIANELVLDHEATALRRSEELLHDLTIALVEGRGLTAMLERIADAAGGPVRLLAADGHRVSGTDGFTEPPELAVEVELLGEHFGWLEYGPATAPAPGRPAPTGGAREDGRRDHEQTAALLERCVPAVQLALLRIAPARRDPEGATVLLDLLGRRYRSVEELTSKLIGLGLRPDRPTLGVALVPSTAMALRGAEEQLRRALRDLGTTGIVANDGAVVLALAQSTAPLVEFGPRLLATVDRRAEPASARPRTLAVGAPADRADAIERSLRDAHQAALLAGRIGLGRRLVLPAESALYRAMVATDDAVLEGLVDDVLGPILRHDAATTRPLLPTLVAYLEVGRSKTAAAARLAVRRQTVHERLQRIARLLETEDVDGARIAGTLELAVTAWQLRRSGSTGR